METGNNKIENVQLRLDKVEDQVKDGGNNSWETVWKEQRGKRRKPTS